MRIDILTLFPRLFSGPLDESLIGKARERGLLNVQIHDIRDFTKDKHRRADDAPYGGGPGMVLKPEPISDAIYNVISEIGKKKEDFRIILMSPCGEVLSQKKAIELSKEENIIILCGRYEGIDERIKETFVTDEISIGDYVLTGGELPAMVLLDVVARQIPGVVKEGESLEKDSFYNGLLDYPCYTRPEEWDKKKVPDVLLSGDHKKIETWRRKQSLERTLTKRPDLLKSAELSKDDKKLLKEIAEEE